MPFGFTRSILGAPLPVAASAVSLGLSPVLDTRSGQYSTSAYEQVNLSSAFAPYVGSTGRLVFQYTSGSSFTGDIQIDDINIGSSNNYSFEATGQGFETTINGSTDATYTDTFYQGLSFTSVLTSGIASGRWNRDLGGTSSGSTGLAFADAGSYYLYVEVTGTSLGYPNKVTWLRSPEVTLDTATLNYALGRYGATIGTIRVFWEVTVLPPSDIEFRVWGAGGGGGSNYSNRWAIQGLRADGGDGGYSVGTLVGAGSLSGTTFYIQVGKGGENIQGGANILFGGGTKPGNGSFYGGQGGGASGVFLANNELKNLSSNTGNVIIVAGGGGGGGNGSHGGHGGGNEGEDAATSGTQFSGRAGGLRGTQSGPGGPGPHPVGGLANFGLGGWSSENLAGGGGGGWFGGSGGDNSTGAGGGSGYVGFSGSGSLPALTSTTNTVAGGSAGGVGNTSTTGNTAGNATDGTDGKVEVWIGGSLSTTFNYTGSMQSFTVP